MTGMRSYTSEAILRDGTSITIRALTAADRDHVPAVFRKLGRASVRHRFFTAKRELAPSDLAFLDRLAGPDVALGAATRTCPRSVALARTRARPRHPPTPNRP